jgi:hypothetical protein
MRGVIFLDYKIRLTINSKLGTARLAREWLARKRTNWSRFNRNRLDLSIRSKRLRRPNPPMIRINYHINADSLIRDNREWLGLRADAPACASLCASLHIQNVIARRQRSTIISVRVCSDPRDFFLFVPTQDEQWIVSIVCRRERRCVFIADINRPGRKDLQMSLRDA